MPEGRVTILGIFVADLAFRAGRLPAIGETIAGSGFKMGPGGKGSNQSVAAARVGGDVAFISKIGKDAFGDIALSTWEREGIKARVSQSADQPTGAAFIFVNDRTGENAIIVVPGACNDLSLAELGRAESEIAASAVFMTQLELPLPLVEHGLAIARGHGVATVLNPAPALPLPERIFAMIDYLTPNESEAAGLVGHQVESIADAEHAADLLLARGARNVLVTLGARGVLVKNASLCKHVPAVDAGTVVDTTGAGDAFNGAFAVALAEGSDVVEAARFGCAAAGLSVTRPGTAPAMPTRAEVTALQVR
jgi:ribokinase